MVASEHNQNGVTREQFDTIGKQLVPEIQDLIDQAGIHGKVSMEIIESTAHPDLSFGLLVSIELQEGEPVANVRSLLERISSRVELVPADSPCMQEFVCSIPSTDLSLANVASEFDGSTFQVRITADSPAILKYSENSPIVTQELKKMPISTLLLSGGGYRATAFHLGVLRWLFEHSATKNGKSGLEQITRMVGVSGGSITAAHFVKSRIRYLRDFEPSGELIAFLMNTDLRTNALRDDKPIEEQLIPLLDDTTFPDGECKLDILGTSIDTGDCVIFSDDNVRRMKIVGRSSEDPVVGNCSCTLRVAVTASAAFPPFLRPISLTQASLGAMTNIDVEGLVPDQVGDGGIRDNTGIEYALSQSWGSNHLEMLMSDAGRPFDSTSPGAAKPEDLFVWGNRMGRVIDIMFHRIAVLLDSAQPDVPKLNMYRKVKLAEREDLSIAKYMQPLIKNAAAEVPKISTDLIPLTESQVFALMRHGFDTANDVLATQYPFTNSAIKNEEISQYWSSLWPNEVKDQKELVEKLRESAIKATELWKPEFVVLQVPGVSEKLKIVLAWILVNRKYAIPALVAISMALLLFGYILGCWFPIYSTVDKGNLGGTNGNSISMELKKSIDVSRQLDDAVAAYFERNDDKLAEIIRRLNSSDKVLVSRVSNQTIVQPTMLISTESNPSEFGTISCIVTKENGIYILTALACKVGDGLVLGNPVDKQRTSIIFAKVEFSTQDTHIQYTLAKLLPGIAWSNKLPTVDKETGGRLVPARFDVGRLTSNDIGDPNVVIVRGQKNRTNARIISLDKMVNIEGAVVSGQIAVESLSNSPALGPGDIGAPVFIQRSVQGIEIAFLIGIARAIGTDGVGIVTPVEQIFTNAKIELAFNDIGTVSP